MCKKNKFYLMFFLFVVLFCCARVVLQAQEQWYLITEPELRSIERYRETSNQEKQDLLLQVSELRSLENRRKAESASLNRQLSEARENQRKSEQLFNEYEAARLTLLSSKDAEIRGLKKELSTEKLKKKGAENQRNILAAAFGFAALLAGAYAVMKLKR